MKKLSIVTVIYNDAVALEKTLISCIEQRNKGASFEHIIIDGASTDMTPSILSKYANFIDICISEKDSGIFDAMNKGLRVATGDSILFLNAGDIFYPKFNLGQFIQNNPLDEKAIFTYTLQQYNEIFFLRPSRKRKIFHPTDFGHQGVFVPQKIYKNIFYDINYSIMADSIWIKEIWDTDICIVSDEISTIFALGGTSSTFSYKNLKRFCIQPANLKLKILFFIKFIIFNIIGQKNTYILLYSKKYDIFNDSSLIEL
jgi:glycosyltransferase involved in cell wall biosynthesis